MDNIVLEMKKIVEEAKDRGFSFVRIRNNLKEYLHYFILDFIYNSEFKEMIFYGGSCLRIIYDLPRMSIDLDFEVEEKTDFDKLKKSLEKYFSADLGLKNKFYIKGEKRGELVNRIFLNFSLMNEVGLSAHESEALKVRIDIMSVTTSYLEKLVPIFTLKSKYGRSMVIKHYDLKTLFASKLAAILDRPTKGFTAGRPEEETDFKGRDFYDLIWYMEERILPNEEMLKLKGFKGSVNDVFDEISLFISKRKLEGGLKRDLEPLFFGSVETFVANFRNTFYRLREERYKSRKINSLIEIKYDIDFDSLINIFKFFYSCEDEVIVSFSFKLAHLFIYEKLKKTDLLIDDKIKIRWPEHKYLNKEWACNYIVLFLSKIGEYLQKHNNEVYFTKWESKLIKRREDNFNPEKEIIFSSGEELALKKITLENLSL